MSRVIRTRAYPPEEDTPSLLTMPRIVGVALALFILVVLAFASTYVVEPGHRGVLIRLGKVDPQFRPEGFGLKPPLISEVRSISVRQQTREVTTEAFSSDLQALTVRLKVLFRIPEASVVTMLQQFDGDPFDSLIAPRVQEALKEDTAQKSAEAIVKQREAIKVQTLASARLKVGDLLALEDIVIEDIALSSELAQAIEAKMVQEQEAAKARFIQEKAEIDARTAVIRAQGEAESIRIRGQALRETPDLIALQIVERWDGRAPLVVGGSPGSSGAGMILPINLPGSGSPSAPAR